jgi:hypothetical protein
LIIILFFANLYGQKIYYSNIPKLNAKAYYNKVIGENKGGIYILKFRDVDLRGGFSIERYSHNMDFISAQSFYLGKKDKLLKVFTTDSGLFLVKCSVNKDKTTFYYSKTGFDLDYLTIPVEIYNTATPDRLNEQNVVDYSTNRQFCSLWVAEKDSKGNQLFHCTVLKINGKITGSKTYNTSYAYDDIALDQTALSDSGETAMVFIKTNQEKRINEPAFEEHFVLGMRYDSIFDAQLLGDYNYFISSYDLVYNKFSNKFNILGFYNFKKPKSSHGIMLINYFPGTVFNPAVFSSFSKEFIGILIGVAEAEEGKDPENYFIRKLIPRSDGGTLIIAEYFEISQQMETINLNGVPQVSTKNIYNYNDLILISVSAIGDIEWERQINKLQSSYQSLAYLNSIGVYACETNTNIVYNDNTNQNNQVMHVSVSRKGVIEKKILLNSENEYSAIVPSEGKQTGYNRYVTPLIQNRQISLIQIIKTD